MPRTDWPSIGERSRPLVAALVADAAALGLAIERAPSRAVLVDAGIAAPGGLEAGRRIAEICMGGLGRVSVSGGGLAHWPTLVSVSATHPVLACLGSQYAGWGLSGGEGSRFHALASGPGRALIPPA
jgi:methenyltetrahydromethanopterin cyclohydrolase